MDNISHFQHLATVYIVDKIPAFTAGNYMSNLMTATLVSINYVLIIAQGVHLVQGLHHAYIYIL